MILLLAACLINEDLYTLRRAALRDDDGDGHGEADCDDQDPQRHPGATEVCDGEDDDCDGIIDEEGIGTFWFLDLDGDGFGNPQVVAEACEAPEGDWVSSADDCEDDDAADHPGADERCDGLDNNCNGVVDEEPVDARPWYLDGDGDGFGRGDAVVVDCSAPPGYVAESGDCDDAEAGAYPGAPELCDGIDNDCDASADEPPIAAGAGAWYPDVDGDGYGDGSGATESRCEGGDGLVDNALDCDDHDGLVHPDAEEVCGDGVDNNCDGDPNHCVWEAEVQLTHGGSIGATDDYAFYGFSAIVADFEGDGRPELYVSGPGVVDPASGVAVGVLDRFDALPTGSSARSGASASVWGEADYEGSVLTSCDYDGDGFTDLLAGVGGFETDGFLSSGELRLWLGGRAWVGGYAHDVSDARLVGEYSYQSVGDEVACSGDVDGDGGVDIIAHGSNMFIDDSRFGAVTVVEMPLSGEADYADSHSLEITPSEDLNTGGNFGLAVVTTDQNGDGQNDLVVTAPTAYEAEGAVYTFYGPLSGSLTEADADVRFYAEGEGLLGMDAASVGDTNHDGFDDIAVSASQYGLGVVYIPWTDPTASAVMMVDAEVKIRADVRRGFGYFIHDLGDLNGDGEIDLGVAEMKYPSSDATIFWGPFDTSGIIPSSAADVHLVGDGSSDYVYSVMSNMGDWNSDGAPELLVGSEEHTGTSYLSGIVYLIPGMGL